MKSIKDLILESKNEKNTTEYVYLDEKNHIVYVSTGLKGADAATIFTDLFDASGFVDQMEMFTFDSGLGNMEPGTAAWFSGHVFDNNENANVWIDAYKKTCSFDEADEACDGWDWDADGVAYVTRDGHGIVIAASDLNNGARLNESSISKIFAGMEKCR